MSAAQSGLLAIFLLVGWSFLLVVGQHPLRIAVIGGGIGGASTAYYLHKQNPSLHVDLFESGKIGGRVQEVQYGSEALELGASIVWSKNFHFVEAAKELNVTLRDVTDDSGKDDSGGIALFNGTHFVFNQSSTWSGSFNMFKRYGPAALSYSRHVNNVWSNNFRRIYDLQSENASYDDPEDMLKAMHLYDLTQTSCAQHMESYLSHWYLWGSARFREELAGAANRVNYNQRNEQLNGLAGLVSWLPGSGSGSVLSVVGGNNKLVKAMLHASNATVHDGVQVTHVNRRVDGSFELIALQPQEEHAVTSVPYHAVIIATPLELTRLVLNVELLQPPLRPPQQYQKTVTTFIKGRLQPSFFNVEELPAQTVYVTNSADTFWSSVSLHVNGSSDNTRKACSTGSSARRSNNHVSSSDSACAGDAGNCSANVYKVFSNAPLSGKQLNWMFGSSAETVTVQEWVGAYPAFSVPERYTPFRLAAGLFYNNAIENAASAMEMSMIAGKNSALLAVQHLETLASGKSWPRVAVVSQDGTAAGGHTLMQKAQSWAEQFVQKVQRRLRL